MSRKLFLSDLDGTLLTGEKIVSPKTKAALDQFVADGNVFAICTGRSKSGAEPTARKLHLDYPGSYIVSYNGAQITELSTNETIYRAEVPLEIVRELFEMGKEYGIHVHSYTDRYIVGSAYDEEMVYYRRHLKIPTIIFEDPMTELPTPPCKVIAIELHDLPKIHAFRDAVNERFGDTLQAIFSNPNYLELFHKDAGKGAAVHRLSEYLHIPMENTMAAGDAENDLSMIVEAGLGIAMCNGEDKIKAAADVITKTDNNHDGLVEFLK